MRETDPFRGEEEEEDLGALELNRAAMERNAGGLGGARWRGPRGEEKAVKEFIFF